VVTELNFGPPMSAPPFRQLAAWSGADTALLTANGVDYDASGMASHKESHLHPFS